MFGVRRRPGGAAAAAAAGVVRQPSVRNVTLLVRVGAFLILPATPPLQYDGLMPADQTFSGICGVVFALKLQEGAQERFQLTRSAKISFERRSRLGRHIAPARGQFGPFRIAEILGASPSI